MRRLDSGSEPFFGDFTVVFNSHLAKAVAVWNLAAMVFAVHSPVGAKTLPWQKNLQSAKCQHVYKYAHTRTHTQTYTHTYIYI